MLTKKSVFSMFLVLLVVLMVTSTASARPLQAALGTGFTYQGRLTDAGVPANGVYDFQFGLFTDLVGGFQVGSPVSLGDVTVTDGLFTVQLDFGNVFDGTALYLEIGVRPGASTGAYSTLVPRQTLTPAPYSIYSAGAPWSGLTGVPAGFADGVDNGSSYQNIKIVAKSGGDFTTITAALNSITDASAGNPYLIFVAPGVYSEQVTMKPYVDIQGAGEQATMITYTGIGGSSTGTVVGANNAELRFLKVENTGAYSYAIAIYNGSTSPHLTHVTASASGGSVGNMGVYNNSASPIMTDVNATASDGPNNVGVKNNFAMPTMLNVTATASGGTYNYGVMNEYSSPTMTNLTVTATTTASGSICYGVSNYGGSPNMTNVIVTASGAMSNLGVENKGSNPTMTNVTATATGGTSSMGLSNTNGSSPTIQDSSFIASGLRASYCA